MPNKVLLWIFLIICVGCGFLVTRFIYHPRIKLGDQYINCNPHAKVNPKKIYRLRLWETDWPVQTNGGYRSYMNRMIRDFQKEYPNIQVQYTLLDLLDSPSRLAIALKNNSAPDVYCSAYTIPQFNYRRQIPVGFYLKRDQQESYFPEALKLTEVKGVPCCFPRWLAPTIWIGNQNLLKGLVADESRGFNLADFQNLLQKLPKEKYLLVGNIGHNGFFTDLAVNSMQANRTTANSQNVNPETEKEFLTPNGITDSLKLLNLLITRRRIPRDFESNALGHFLKGNSVVLAGVRPLIYRFIKIKLASLPDQTGCQPKIIPSLQASSQSFTLTENGVICIYRNKMTVGDDQIAAAVKLGQFISTYEDTKPFQDMMLMPASSKCAYLWCKELKPLIGDVGYLIQLVEHTKLLSIPDFITYQKSIYPVLQDFCNQKISQENAQTKLAGLKWQ